MSTCSPLILQGFEWHTTSDNESHYARLTKLLPTFAHLGVTSLWLPPGCKANDPRGNGYDIYDLWDLGEFEQKGSRGTKWGNREELSFLLSRAKELKINIIWDAVLNHKAGADAIEEVWAVEVDGEDRRYEICAPKIIQAWLQFDFPGRRHQDGTLKHSEMNWRSDHFNGVDWEHREKKNAIFKLIDDPVTLERPFIQPKRPTARPQSSRHRLSTLLRRFSSDSGKSIQADAGPIRRPGKGWSEDVDKENGNADYLMFSNIDYSNQDVQDEVKKWGEWMISEVGIQGFRLDAVQHYSFHFSKDWIRHVQNAYSRHSNDAKDMLIIGEVWSGIANTITTWLDAVQEPSGRPQVFAYDAPLLYNFSRISEDIRQRSKNIDLRTILRGSLLTARPEASVTLVMNHDTQPGQTCYTPMWSRLKLLWYAFILLREEGLPCVFWGDLFGVQGPYAEPPIEPGSRKHEEKNLVMSDMLVKLMLCRKYFAFGEQRDYWQSATSIGWTREGGKDRSGCAVILSASPGPKTAGSIQMQVGLPGDIWLDITGRSKDEVKIDTKGLGIFGASGLNVWVKKGSEEMLVLPQQGVTGT